MAAPHMPEEILIEVFSRLPTKSVGTYRCLSKSWNNYLSSQEFIKIHLSRKSHEQQENLILISPSNSLRLINEDVISKKVELLDPATRDGTISQRNGSRNKWKSFIGSCNGLVLLFNVADEMCVVNPITLQQVIIPASPYGTSLCSMPGSGCGFGYNSSSDDYNVVIFYACDTGTLILVYSLKKKLWSEFAVSHGYYGLPMCSCPYLDGVIHWLATSKDPGNHTVIVAFDFAYELFVEIPLPPCDGEKKYVGYSLFVHKGCLCVSRSQSNGMNELWIMKKYSLGKSWTEFSVVNGDWKRYRTIPLWFTKNQECVLATSVMSFLKFCFGYSFINLKDGGMKYMVVDGCPYFLSGGIFVDSLVSPN